jgi:alpha/beta superfamily hydrolase
MCGFRLLMGCGCSVGTLAQVDRPVILRCHGNAGRIINRLENLRELYRIGLSVFIFNYRGYGRSQGRPSEEGFDQGCVQ